MARDDDDVALVFAQLGERRLRVGLAALLDRRLVAPALLRRYLADGPRDLRPPSRAAPRWSGSATLRGMAGGLEPFLRSVRSATCSLRATGAVFAPRWRARTMQAFDSCRRHLKPHYFGCRLQNAARRTSGVSRARGQAAGYFLTQDGRPRGERSPGPCQSGPLRLGGRLETASGRSVGLAPAL
jgi:hypothetical protein